MREKEAEKPLPLSAQPFSGEIEAEIAFGGDKSISHRLVILSALACGRSEIVGLSRSTDVAATIKIMRQLGVSLEEEGERLIVQGVGLDGLLPPDDVLDCGNSGTGARLLLGVLASHKISCVLAGDESLSKRPMAHVMKPLARMGVHFVGSRDRLPLVLDSSRQMNLTPIDFESPLPSAQLKSAVILAALNIAGETTITEPMPTRDHTERILDGMKANIEKRGDKIIVKGQQELEPNRFSVPADISSASFFAALVAMSEKGELLIKNVSLNPHRAGFFNVLKKMGGNVELLPSAQKNAINEPIGDIRVKGGEQLLGVDVAANEAVSMIDEYPILSVLAAHASGTTNMRGLAQLRVKESDRLSAIAENLNANGVEAQIRGDDLTIIGRGGRVAGGGFVKTYNDHRIAMAFLIQGASAERAITIDDSRMIKTSFPDFTQKISSFGVVLKNK